MLSPSNEVWLIFLLATTTILSLCGALIIIMVLSNRRLKKERDFSNNIVDTNPALIIALDDNGKIVRFNKNCEIMSGYKASEVLGRDFHAFPLVRERIFPEQENIFEKSPNYFESQWVNKNGRKCTIAWSAVKLENSIIEWIISGIDITERKRIEEELSESRLRLELALDGSMGGMWDFEFEPDDPPSYIPDKIYISPRLKKFIGYEDHEFPNSMAAWLERILPEDIPLTEKSRQDHLEGKSDLYEIQYRIQHKDNSIRWLLSRGKIKRNEFGQPVRWTGIDWDITERRKAEKALFESEERLRTVMEKIPIGVAVIIEDKTEYANPALCKLSGNSSEELQGKSCIQLFHSKYRKKIEKKMKQLLEGAREYTSEYTLVRRDGKVIPVEVDARKIIYDGKTGLLAIFRDITERKTAEKALNEYHKKLQRLSSHLQNVREEERAKISREIHDELGQELSIVLLDIGWLEQHSDEDIEVLQNKLRSISTLIEATMEKVQKIAMELRPSIIDHFGLPSTLEWQANQFMKKTGIKCTLNFSDRKISVNEEISIAIFRIFQESLTNIIRHAHANAVEASLIEESKKLIFKVSDNGKGISKSKMMEPKSFGLLSIQERARSLNGKFEIDGEPDKGTTLTVTIPLGDSQSHQR